MNYRGQELIELEPQNFGVQHKRMVVWNDNETPKESYVVYAETFNCKRKWLTSNGNFYNHWAEIPLGHYIIGKMYNCWRTENTKEPEIFRCDSVLDEEMIFTNQLGKFYADKEFWKIEEIPE